MLQKIFQAIAYRFRKIYTEIANGIAFYPTLIAVGLFFLSLLSLYIDKRSPGLLLGYEIPIKNILYPASARTLLGVIAGGMISLMVFSFSMVMVILSQTSSNYSPRLLPNLIGQRSKQIVMGFYIGTIAYTFTVLTSIDSKLYAFGVPTLSIIVNSLLSLVCLALFVSFINDVSKDIQIGNIINHVYQDTLRAIRREVEKGTYVASATLPETQAWTEIASPRSGYLNSVSERFFLRATRRLDVTVKLCVPLGKFVNRRDPLFLTDRTLNDKEQEELLNTLVFEHHEDIQQQYGYGFKHLTEVALKALSPGINDPGTAIQAIDRLTDLLVESMEIRGQRILTDKQQLRLIYEPLFYSEVFYLSVNAIREYGQQDLTITLKLLTLLHTVSRNDTEDRYTDTTMTLLHDMVQGYSENFINQSNRRAVVNKTNTLLDLYPKHQKNVPIRSLLATLTLVNIT